MMTLDSLTTGNQAIEYLAHCRFHRRFILPATGEHEAFPVTYSDVGADGSDNVPTVLLIGGMYGTRYLGVHVHHLAAKMGVRIVSVDRYVLS